jgi:preprotein translocase subunit SecF
MFIIKHRKIFVGISILFVALSIFSMSYFGLNFGIDFKGGSLLEIEYVGERPSPLVVENVIKSVGIGSSLIQPVGESGYSIKARDITDAEKNSLLQALGGGVTEVGFNSVGPSVGAELVKKSIISFILVALGIILGLLTHLVKF